MTQDMTEMIFSERDIECELTQGSSPRAPKSNVLRFIVVLFTLLMSLGATSAWGETDFSGTYYIANETNHGDATIDTHWYLVPGANPQQPHYADAYFHNQYCNTSGKGDYTGSNYGNPEKPFLTTYQTNQDLNSIWIISSTGDGYYNIKHAKTGYYVVYEPPYKDAKHRKSMHLESTTSPGDNAKFTITGSSLSGPININPKSVTSGNMYFNPAVGVGNRAQYYGTGDYFHEGMIGLWESNADKSQWYLEKTVVPPTITYDDETGMATITSVTGTTICYEFDDDTPTNSSTTYSTPVNASDHTAINAIAVDAQGITSKITTLTLKSFTYYIINKTGTIAIQGSIKQAVGKPLSSYTDIPAVIRSPYLEGEDVSFYSFTGEYASSKLNDDNKITETPTDNDKIYVEYTTTHLSNQFLQLDGASPLNVKSGDNFLFNNEGILGSEVTDANATKNDHLWYISGGTQHDPYVLTIRNAAGKYLTSTSNTLGLSDSSVSWILIGKDSSHNPNYEEITLRNSDGTEQFTVKVNNVSLPTSYYIIDLSGKQVNPQPIPSPEGAAKLDLPLEWQSTLVSEYHYYKAASKVKTKDGQRDSLVVAEADRITELTQVGDDKKVYVTYVVNNNVIFDTTGDGKTGATYRLEYVNGEDFCQEDGSDGVMTEAQKAVYPYCNGDGMFFVYGKDQWTKQLNSGASTRSRWLWYVVSPTSDPYHVTIMSEHFNSKPIDKGHGYFRTFPVTYKDRETNTNVTRYVTSMTTKEAEAASVPPTEYMVLKSADGHSKLVTIIDGVCYTVNSFEQYWKNRPTVQEQLGGSKVTELETYEGNIILTEQQEQLLPPKWHTYQALVNSGPWVGWTGDGHSGTGRQYKNKNHWFQTVNMAATEGSDGEFEFIETTLLPQVILIDNHGWEIMRKPLYDKDGNLNAELKIYDSPMVDTYHWHPTSTKVDGYHKYTVDEDDAVITIYYKNEAGKWVPDGNTTTFTSTTLYDDPYVKIKNEYQEQDASVKTDFYVTYTVKPEYARQYSGAATKEAAKASSFMLKQGNQYAVNSGNTLTSTIPETTPTIETVENSWKWYMKPNFDIDAEMGYKYGGENGEKSQTETEEENFTKGRNGFDPYNVQIQSVSNDNYYFTANTKSPHLDNGAWAGTTEHWPNTEYDVTLQNLRTNRATAEGYDHTTLAITNATFMIVDDGAGNMRLMPRFDHSKVVDGFTVLATPNGTETQKLTRILTPQVIHSSSELTVLGGQFILASDFTFESNFESIGSEANPFTGSIDGRLNTLTGLSIPLVAYAKDATIKNVILNNVNITGGSGGNELANVGAIAANATGDTRIYNCGILSGSVSGSEKVGGLVGMLDGNARVINCFSYANITGGSDKGGIVGYNNVKTTAAMIGEGNGTMVMNCMFYGDISSGGNISPVYGGEMITNLKGTGNNTHGLNNFNYYAYDELKTGTINKYNCALAMEERYLNRFEIYRLLLNSNKKLAAIYASSPNATVYPEDMMKWVLETADRQIENPKPYPVLKAQGYYPSIINYDVDNATDLTSRLVNGKPKEEDRNKGGKIGTLTVTISESNTTSGGQTKPTGATVFNTDTILVRTDKDYDHFNYNYDKVQLPYYNDVGTNNYTDGKVVTGWKITSITASGEGAATQGSFTASDSWGGYNFADRKTYAKDLYSGSGRVFSQGAYFDVPYGVTAITIEPYWGKAAFVADASYDVIYDGSYNRQDISQLGEQVTNSTKFNGVSVKTSINAALGTITSPGSTVYDNAIVLVGNFHQNVISGKEPFKSSNTPFTIMSVDMDNDHEPDYSLIFHDNNRSRVNPIRFDFLNIPGTAQAQKPNGAGTILNASVFNASAWFEITNTCLIYFSQFEYENSSKTANKSPIILLGGVYDQFVSTKVSTVSKTTYLHVGGNAWFNDFGNGTHSDGSGSTKHIPISVTGGEYKGFYLTGTYNADAAVNNDNAECYISGGHFEELAGAGLEQIGGNVQWQIYNADIDNFFGGGVNENKPILGTITTNIYNSHVGTFCGGPKFGNMQTDKAVTTTAEGCTFDKYFGAGYGGNSVSRKKYSDLSGTPNWNTLQGYYTGDKGKYYDGSTTPSNQVPKQTSNANYGNKGKGVATDFEYEFFVWTSGKTGVRLFVDFASFSLAQCNNVNSTLTSCTINQNFYGGGSLGSVTGTATSVLDGCTVNGNVFGGGYSATLPKIKVRNSGFTTNPNFNTNSGMFEPGVFSGTTDYEWKQIDSMPSEGGAGTEKTNNKNYVHTDANLTALGQVATTDLTIKGNTIVKGQVFDTNDDGTIKKDGNGKTIVLETTGGVFGGGDMSAVNGNTSVTILGTNTEGINNVFGGGNTADVLGNDTVSVVAGTMKDVYGGGRGSSTTVEGKILVNIGKKINKAGTVVTTGAPSISGDVYGGSALGAVNATKAPSTGELSYTGEGNNTTVNIYAGTVTGSVFGGGLGEKTDTTDIAAQNFGNAEVNMEGGTVSEAIYGGANANGVLKADAKVTLLGGAVGTSASPINNVVFGGGKGEPTLVNGNVTVNIGTLTGSTYTGTATVNGNVYGGSALGNTNASGASSFNSDKSTNVNLYAGTIYGNVFGGGLGQQSKAAVLYTAEDAEVIAGTKNIGDVKSSALANVAAIVGGDVNVLLDGAKLNVAYTGEKTAGSDNRVFTSGQIFGCNNLNGTPKGHVKVHVKRTVNTDSDKNALKNTSTTALADRTTYDIPAVYGGGNQADYYPTDADNEFAEVIIEGCDKTSIEFVYGGGNAAAVPADSVKILSCYIIDQVFGGGNGAGTGNPGADVGIINKTAYAADPTTGIYGTGKAVTKLVGGQVHVVYGGSNTLGNVRGGTSLERNESNSCTLKIGEIYGAGQVAPMDGDVNITLECMPEEFVPQVFGGAKNATVNGNVSLTVTSGKFGRVFGGNNEGGSINGSITVNVYEDGCRALKIGELYGGGFNAPYSIWGCNDDDEDGTWTPNTPSGTPHVKADTIAVSVNVYSCTSIGKVFGGGYGSTANVVGNTHVWVNTMQGIVNEEKQTYGTDVYIGKIGQVFGGGNAAPVKGNVTIDIGTATVNQEHSTGQDTEKIGIRLINGTDYLNPSADRDTTITAGIYGGGFSADVDGDVTLNIGTARQNQGINIGGDIFGGGFGETTVVTGNVTVNIGKDSLNIPVGYANITGDVYGGSAKGKVNTTNGTSISDGTPTTHVNLYGGTISGNLYGGGLGDATHAADVYGADTVNVKGGSANNVFGCNNVNGTPKSTVTVNIDGGRIYKSVYGGGNQAIMDGSPVVNVTAGTIGTDNEGNTVYGGAVYGNVYGGGLGSDGTGEQADLDKVKAGLVKGNTAINISGGTILHNIYGGGAYGSVGSFTYDNSTNLPTGLATANTGKATINITGGTIGTNGHNNGMVFGSSRGDIDSINAIHDKLAWVYDTEVKIGTANDETAGPQINGSLYGGGENGHVFNDASVTMLSGTVGNMEEYYSYRGNVYGGGCGTDLYYSGEIPEGHTKHDGEGDKYNPKAGIVGNDAKVEIKGGSVANNIYGAGSMGKVGGSTSVTIDTNGAIGVDGNHDDGNVYGAARGELNLTGKIVGNPDDYSSVTNSSVEIKNGTVKGSVFGGGKAGAVKGNVAVTVSGGTVKNDVYGGGALANTNTDNWDETKLVTTYEKITATLTTGVSVVTGLYKKDGDNYILQGTDAKAEANAEYYRRFDTAWAEGKTSASNTTTVTLTGGTIGNVFGGGLGNDETPVYVYGDVAVHLNNATERTTYGGTGASFTRETAKNVSVGGKNYPTIPTTGKIFGANNFNGSPKGDVTVEIWATKRVDGKAHVLGEYEIHGVYGGGNQADYLPATSKQTKVIVHGCDDTSIEYVYGGGNSASVPSTDVTIYGSFDIGYAFGGGNGSKPVKNSAGTWIANGGAMVTGDAKISARGGRIGQVFGGSDAKGDILGSSTADIKTTDNQECTLILTRLFGAGNEADVNGDVNMILSGCTSDNVQYVHGGSYNAHITGDVNLTITSGFYTNVFGGNDARGSIGGKINVNIEETDNCKPIVIHNLVGGGNEAPYPGTKRDETEYPDDHPAKVTVNIKSATRIDNVYGGGYKANVKGDTEVNINMMKGSMAGTELSRPTSYTGDVIPNVHVVESKTYINDAIGTIGNVYGGGNEGNVLGNTVVNIGTATGIKILKREGDIAGGALVNEAGNPVYDGEGNVIKDGDVARTVAYVDTTVLGAHITGDVFGGGNLAYVTGSTYVNISSLMTPVLDNESKPTGEYTYSKVDHSGTTGFEGISISNGSVYGGGNSADVLKNTRVTMSDGYIFNGIFGGGYSGSVGTFTTSDAAAYVNVYGHTTHTGCIGKPVSCADGTGKCTVVVNGGQIGPVTVATVGMDPTNAHGGPVPQGWVWGGGCGLIEDPATNPDTHFKTYVGSTDVTISGTAFIMEGVIGGGEFGRVLGNTLVKIEGGQIGVGENQTETVGGVLKPKRYEEAQFINPLTTEVTNSNALPECSHYDYKSPFWPYDPYYEEYNSPAEYAPASTATPSDGKTWIGVVFGGGSGYMPYKKAGGSGYDWCRSAGWVEGDAKVQISGGHILTNVYGGNEYTDVKGKCTVEMTGGTIGVPRTLEQIAKHPVTCYLFGGGKGDQRSHFNTMTNVGSVEVDVSGGIIYGSVFGGSEDGHVLGNASVTVRKGDSYTVGGNTITTGPVIGTWGTSYVDGNIFGGGRGFSGTSLTAGSVEDNVTMTISGGNILGSVYGGGRMASVGIDFMDTETTAYGQLIDDETTGENPKTHGHITMNISGGTIGGGRAGSASDLAAKYYDMKHSGNVFGGSMGRLTLLDGTINSLWPKMSIVKTTSVTISEGADIKRNVYGGSEYGIVRNQTTINMTGGTVGGSVFGGGYGSDDNQTKTTIIPAGYETQGVHFTFIPMLWAGCSSGNTTVNISGGAVKNNVYGGGELASVGLINFNSDEYGTFNKIIKHTSLENGFGLSWPYKFEYIHADPKDTSKDGKATVTISGGTIGTKEGGNYVGETGYVFGGCKGQVAFGTTDDIDEQRYTEAFMANVRETNVTISGGTVRTVYGGGEDGHVNENAKVTINSGATITRTVFGGGKGTSTFTTTLWDTENAGQSKITTDNVCSWTAGKVYGNTEVIMNGGSVGWFIYGGGNVASVGKGNYAGGADDYSTGGYGETLTGNLWDNESDDSKAFLSSGKTSVTILGGNVGPTSGAYAAENGVPHGSVFGGSRGKAAKTITLSPRYKYGPDFYLGYVNKATINIGGTTENGATDGAGPNIYGSIYGGGQDGHVRNSTEIKIFKGDIKGQTGDDLGRSGNVFGAGSGIGTYTDGNNAYCNNASGSVTCTTLVEVSGDVETTKIKGNVYGGGALASVGPPKITQSKNEQKEASSDHASYSYNRVNIKGGSIGGSVFGASRGPGDSMFSGVNPTFTGIGTGDSQYNPATYSTSLWTEVNVTGGTIANNVYGGGEMGRVKESTVVNLTGGKVTHDAYGGGMGTRGTNAIPAMVLGNTTVELNKGVTDNAKGCIIDKIFGCNDLNGSPKGHVTVHVYATQNSTTDDISTKVGTIETPTYDVTAVYGGGDLAPYEPDIEEEKTEVIIEGCSTTSIKQVYGGGNAASVPATSVNVKSCHIIDEVFGGGNGKDNYQIDGKWYENPGAHVGYTQFATYDTSGTHGDGLSEGTKYQAIIPTEADGNTEAAKAYRQAHYRYGTGIATTTINGGHMKHVYGGSNEKGNVSGETRSEYQQIGDCTMTCDEQYGGGKNADTDAETTTVLDCVDYDESNPGKIYGGSFNANINSDVNIFITNGTYDKIFGGNNKAGTINGKITITVEEYGCTPIRINELYAGGNLAPYSVYGFKTETQNAKNADGSDLHEDDDSSKPIVQQRIPYREGEIGARTTPYWDPRINIISATSIGKIFGGGYGAGATLIGNPHVNVNMTTGKISAKYANYKETYDDDYPTTDTEGNRVIPIGTIGTIYGGGNLASVEGDTYVEIGTGQWIASWENGNPVWESTTASGVKYSYKEETPAVYYKQTECDEYNAENVAGYIASGTVLSSEQVTKVKDALGTNYVAGAELTTKDANAYNATLSGARKTTDVKETIYYTQAECNEYNAGLEGAVSTSDINPNTSTNYTQEDADAYNGTLTGARKTTDVKTTVYYTQAECDAYNATTFPDDYIAKHTKLTADEATRVNNALTPSYTAGQTISAEHANAYNATLEGARKTTDVKDKAVWAWYDANGVKQTTAPTLAPRNTANITGDVFGGGKGEDAASGTGAFQCAKGMIGVDGDGIDYPEGGTNVTIGNGTVTIGGSVYGGGEVGRVEKNTSVTIGLGDGTGTGNYPVISKNVFGAGKGVPTHGYSALVRGNSTVTIQGDAKVLGSVYGGGEIASIGRYNVVGGIPTSLKNPNSGNCTVTIQGYAEIGPDDMTMPDNLGHVFGAGKGATPYIDKNGNAWANPWSIIMVRMIIPFLMRRLTLSSLRHWLWPLTPM